MATVRSPTTGASVDNVAMLIDIYRNLQGAGAPVDVIVVTPEEVERYRDDPCLIIAPALKEGKIVYAA